MAWDINRDVMEPTYTVSTSNPEIRETHVTYRGVAYVLAGSSTLEDL